MPWGISTTVVFCAIFLCNELAAGEPATKPATTQAGEIPILYCEYFEPEKLTSTMYDEIIRWAEHTKPTDSEIWYMYVRYHRRGSYTVDVYFKPTSQAGSVHHGECVTIKNDMSVDQRRAILKQLGKDPNDWPRPRPYVYVAKDAADLIPIVPDANMLPFSPLEGMSDEDLASVIAAARQAMIDGAAAEEKRGAEDSYVGMDPSMPINRLDTEDGKINIWFGWQVGPLNGQGIVLTMSRTKDGWKVTGQGMWVS